MSDVSPYGVTQNADAALVTADALVGAPAGSQRENAAVGSAAMFSTAPYIPPGPKPGQCYGKGGTCRAAPIKGTNLCIFHSPGLARHDRVGDE
jgi:hypothetical protein